MRPDYYSVVRDDILALVPRGTRRLLDVGCGTGATGAAAKELHGVQEVVGVEAVEPVARVAAVQLDRVFTGDIETLELGFPDGYFDCIVFADVLEHTRDPWSVLRKIRRLLSDDGVIIASIPNLRNIVPLLKIVFDKFEYEDSNILDRTHLRFFTLYTMKSMFGGAGYRIIRIFPERYESWKFSLLHIASLGLMRPFSIYRYLIVARKEANAEVRQAGNNTSPASRGNGPSA